MTTLYSTPCSYPLETNGMRVLLPVLLSTSHNNRRSTAQLQNIPKTLSVLECVKTVPKRLLISIERMNKYKLSVCVLRANIDPSFRPVTFVHLPKWFMTAGARDYLFFLFFPAKS